MANFEHFQALSASVYQHTPSPAVSGPIIILCTWMAASPKLVSRYATTYRTTFPTATIILITSSVTSFIYTPKSEWAKLLGPAIDFLLSRPDSTVYGIAYSNGGLQSLIQLALAFRSKTGRALDLENSILDSAPGSPEITVAHRAMILSFNLPTLAYYPAYILLWLYLALTWVYMALSGAENPIDGVRDKINDPTLFKPGKRVYVYSKEDQMVPWVWVEANASLAERRGWEVEKELFKGSKHVAHAMIDKERYWTILKRAIL